MHDPAVHQGRRAPDIASAKAVQDFHEGWPDQHECGRHLMEGKVQAASAFGGQMSDILPSADQITDAVVPPAGAVEAKLVATLRCEYVNPDGSIAWVEENTVPLEMPGLPGGANCEATAPGGAVEPKEATDEDKH